MTTVAPGEPFRLARAADDEFFVALATESGVPVAVLCRGCVPGATNSTYRLITWDSIAPDAPSRARGSADLPVGTTTVRVLRGGAYYAATYPNPMDINVTRVARFDPVESTFGAPTTTFANGDNFFVGLDGDERSSRLAVRFRGESSSAAYAFDPRSGTISPPEPVCLGARGERIVWGTISTHDVTVDDGVTRTVVSPSMDRNDRYVGLRDDGPLYLHVAQGGSVLYVQAEASARVVSRLPDEIHVALYVSGTQRAVATDGLAAIFVHDPTADAWQTLVAPATPRDPRITYLDTHATVVENDSAFFATSGAEIWVVPKAP